MVIEYVRYGLADAAQAAAFERDWARAAHWLDASVHCRSYCLARCDERPLQYILQIGWASDEAHLIGLHPGPALAPFAALVQPYASQLLERRLYRPTAVVGGCWPGAAPAAA